MSQEIGTATAVIQKVQTTADKGLRVTLDIPSTEFQVVQELMKIYTTTDSLVVVAFIKPEER